MRTDNQQKKEGFSLLSTNILRRYIDFETDFSFADVLVRSIGFLMSRAVIIPQLAPFGLAFLAINKRLSLGSICSFLVGILGYISLIDPGFMRYIGASVIYMSFLSFTDKTQALSQKNAIIAAVGSIALCDILSVLWTGFSISFFLILVSDAIFVFLGILIFDRLKNLLSLSELVRHIPDNEEKISLCLMLGMVLLSFRGLSISGFFSLANFLGFILLGIAATSGGLLCSAIFGTAIGFLTGIQTDLLACLAIYSCAGLICGISSRFQKYGVPSAIVFSGSVLPMLVSGASIGVQPLEGLLAALSLLFMPKQVFYWARRFMRFDSISAYAENSCLSYLQSRLSLAAQSFHTLAQTFFNLSDAQDKSDMQDIALLFDTAADRVCRNCSRVRDCWENNFNSTYKAMLHFFDVMEKKGSLTPDDTEGYFSGRCLHLNAMVRELNQLFDIYKANNVWKKKLSENRTLVGEQFSGVAEILNRLQIEFNNETAFDRTASEELIHRLNDTGIYANDLQVIQTLGGRRTVQLSLPAPDKTLIDEIPSVLQSVLGTPFSPSCLNNATSDLLYFYEVPPIHMEAAFAATGMDTKCGDSHMLSQLRGGKYIATLSDGMGTGESANRESGAIIELLEAFMDAGFDKTIAVKLLNSVMVMKSADEAFATVDMCMVDLYTGEAEFIKNGAEPSYIKRTNGVETVRSASLPVGMLSGIEADTFAHRLDHGDFVVMVSDGIELRNSDEKWLRRTISGAPYDISAQQLANQILEKAKKLKGGNVDDDMTVLVLHLLPQQTKKGIC